jgi:hypothetical protein
MPALFPMMSAPEDFRPNDCVRKFVSENGISPHVGVVTHIIPATFKVWVQWPTEHSQESPETLLKVNPDIVGFPTALTNTGYDSYEKTRSEKQFGKAVLKPRMASEGEKMAIRVAHTFATDIVGKLVDDVCALQENGLSDIQAYNKAFIKYGSVCSDHIIRMSVAKIYGLETKE